MGRGKSSGIPRNAPLIVGRVRKFMGMSSGSWEVLWRTPGDDLWVVGSLREFPGMSCGS